MMILCRVCSPSACQIRACVAFVQLGAQPDPIQWQCNGTPKVLDLVSKMKPKCVA